MKKLCYSAILIVLAMAFSCPAWAQVSGQCANCHTMHNSDDGGTMVAGGGAAQPTLLTNTCVGCHTGVNDGTNTIPYVHSTTTAPVFGTNTLAGGNFYWVENVNDAKGHNVFFDNPDEALNAAGTPGYSIGCGLNDCHTNLHEPNTTGPPSLVGRQGCTKCHMVDDVNGPKGFHHADDGIHGTTIVGSETPDTDGYYRFLKGHMSANGQGVSGIEHAKWNYGATSASHNEYMGKEGSLGSPWAVLSAMEDTMLGFCSGCHGNFHIQDSGGQWIRHPSDAVIPNSGEYAYAFGAAGSGVGTYDPNVPVARPSLSSVSSSVTLGTDMVMCLSCHVPHGSPNDDMLRWDYNGMVAGTSGGAAGTGCFKCHTAKDGI